MKASAGNSETLRAPYSSPSIGSVSKVSEGTTSTSLEESGDSGSQAPEYYARLCLIPQERITFTENRYKDNATILESHIQAERLRKILDETIYKTKIAVAFPVLIKDNILCQTLNTEDFKYLLYIFENFFHTFYSHTFYSSEEVTALMENLIKGSGVRQRLSPELAHVIHTLTAYESLKPKVEEIADEMKNKTPVLEYLRTLEQFRELMVTRMETTAAEELANKLEARRLEKSNNVYIVKIEEIQRLIVEEDKRLETTMAEKKDIIKSLEDELIMSDAKLATLIEKKVNDSVREMISNQNIHLKRLALLKNEAVDVKEQFTKYLQRSLISEKKERAHKLKVEIQLQQWIQKYDTEMKDKQMELDEYVEKLEEEQRRVKQLEEDLEEQYKEYRPLMAEKEAEYQLELTKKMDSFLRQHACRVIQHAWRQILQNRAEKKKLQYELNKKKAEEEKAEKIAKREMEKAAKEAKRREKEAKIKEKNAKAAELREAKEAAKAAAVERAAAAKAAKKELTADSATSVTTTSLNTNSTFRSSRSAESIKTTVNEFTKDRDEDFTKDNSVSPIDLECEIQAERITKILNEALYKTKVVCVFNKLVFDYYNELKSMLSEQDLEALVFIYKCGEVKHSLLNLGAQALDDIREGNLSLKNRLSTELGYIMCILSSCKQLQPLVENIVKQMKIDCQNETEDSENFNSCVKYLMTFEQFKDIMIKRMKTSAAEMLFDKLNVMKQEKSNEEYIKLIKDLNATLRKQEDDFNIKLSEKKHNIFKLEQQLGFIDNISMARINQQVKNTDYQMVKAHREHKIRNEILKEDEVEARDRYDKLLNRSLRDEKNQRARRLKIEAQLVSWIQKYDTDMSQKQSELDDFIKKYKDECTKVKQLEKDIEEQNKEYIPLMAEREEEYNQEMTAKMEAFIVEHAAKVLQNAWREVLKNRAEKKKLKKAIQKKKQAEEKAALKAEAEAKKAEIKAKKEAKAAAKEAKAEAARLAKEAKEAKAAAAKNNEG